MGRAQSFTSFFEALSAGSAAARFSVQNAFLRGPLGRHLWRGGVGTALFDLPAGLRAGSPLRGELWLAGDYTLPGGIVRGPGQMPFLLPPPSEAWHDSLHGFDWLADLLAVPEAAGHQAARDALLHWAQSDCLTRKKPMAPQLVGRRLARWSLALSVLKSGFDSQELARLQLVYAQQARWLARTFNQIADTPARLQAAIGLTCAGLALTQEGHLLRQGMDLLMRDLRRQVLPDGGHMSRRPDILVGLLADLIAVESGLAARQIAPPPQFAETLSRMQSMLVMLRHNDGKLAVFQGGLENEASALAAVLPKKPAAAASFAQKSGYQRLHAAATCLLVDVGNAPAGAYSLQAHAAPLAFEMSHDGDRLIVNCGPNQVHGTDWQLAARGLSAHSTLAFDHDITDPFLRHGMAARRLGPRLKPEDWQVTARRVEDKTGIWLETSHAIFVPTHGVRHNRRFFMDALGQDVRGEDLLLADMNHTAAEGAPFHLRFHLHPDVTASLQTGGDSVLLLTPRGHGWQFRVGMENGVRLKLEESVYMGRNGVPQRSRQLAISGALGHTDTLIRWALRYAGRSGRR